ncbi:uncharacterized protein LOC119216660 [Pungitius pungitius]|uniref:uncharacterized protein LOC119216660 n=1 Tax=Pungitius pungitius TaxID=134920 RepID=UPI002E10AF87
MDQGDTFDFQALRAKFQAEELFLKRPTLKPALPEKPMEVPPPQSPTHFLPVGARPSLLTSISPAGRSAAPPRVIFKEGKKEGKKPLIQINGKDKTRGGKEKPDKGPMEQNGTEKKPPKEKAPELVPAMPPPPPTIRKKKPLLGFMKRSNSIESLLDAPPSDNPGPAPVILPPLIPPPLIPAPVIPPPPIPAPVILPPPTPAPVILPPPIPAPVILPPPIPAPVILPPPIPAPVILPPPIPAPVILPPPIPAPVILPPPIPAPVIPPPPIPAPVIPPPLIPAPVIPPPPIPAPVIPPPPIPAPVIPPPPIPAPVIPPPLIPAPVILPPPIPAPVILPPPIPAPVIPPPPIPAPVIPPPPIPAPIIPPPLIPAPVILPPPIPAPVITPPPTPAPVIPPPLIPDTSQGWDDGVLDEDPVFPAYDIPPPLIPAPVIPPPLILAPKALLPTPPTLRGPDAAVERIPVSLDLFPTPVFVPAPPSPKAPRSVCEAMSEIECPPLSIPRPASQDDVAPTPPPDASTSHLPGRLVSAPPPATCTSSPSPPQVDELPVEFENMAVVDAPPASPPPSPKAQHPTSALAVLSRVEDLSPGRKTSPCDKRIFNLLEKARTKTREPTNPSLSNRMSPPPEELPPSPAPSLPELPPVDYGGNAAPPKPVNSFNPRQLPPVMERIPEEGVDPVPELLLVPPPVLLGPLSEKPSRPTSVKLSPLPSLAPPTLADNRVAAPSRFSETDHVALDAPSHWGGGNPGLQISDKQNLPNGTGVEAFKDPENPDPESSPPPAGLKDQVINSVYDSTENVYEAMPASGGQKKGGGHEGKKRKGSPKNPYAEAQQETNGAKSKTSRFSRTEKKAAAEGSDEKEQKKKEKQRLEKEKKELKEKEEREKKELKEKMEREKKERKEKEKKENGMKKKFKITGQEDAMYQAKVTVTNKGRKNDLPVTCGDVVSIIRTSNCPKGKWLARSSSNNFGYIAVDYLELDITEMMELGKKATISRLSGVTNTSVMEEEASGPGSRASNHYPMSTETFSDDSEEWSGDEEEPLSPSLEPEALLSSPGHTRTLSMPDMGKNNLSVSHAHSSSDIIADGQKVQATHEALQKLATFFHSAKPEAAAASDTKPEKSPLEVKKEAVPLSEVTRTQEMDLVTDMIILPPPDLYADFSVE